MKLQSFNIVFVLGVVKIANVVDSVCLLRDTLWSKPYWFQCFRSNDYLTDVNKAPVDVFYISFSNSRIQFIKNKSFARLSKSLERLVVQNSGVEEIEDNAFEELHQLKLLALCKNKLQVVKSAWFNGLTKLTVVLFNDNHIKHVEDNFFTILPTRVEVLDISNNQLTCLPTKTPFENTFITEGFLVWQNPLSWTCRTSLMNWLSNKESGKDSIFITNVDPPFDMTKICASSLPAKRREDEEFRNECIQKTIREFLLTGGNYTVQQLCEFLKDKPSPFLDCNK